MPMDHNRCSLVEKIIRKIISLFLQPIHPTPLLKSRGKCRTLCLHTLLWCWMLLAAAFMLAFVLLIVIFAIINCSLFGEAAPQYFATPLDSIYSVFRLFTVEGWYDIPDAITATLSPVWSHVVRIYFCLLLIGGGIIGMSLINSIFVDAMVADNNDDVKEQLRRIEEKLDRLEKKD